MFVSAAITTGVAVAEPDRVLPSGEPPPSADALLQPSGGTAEAFAAKHVDAEGHRHLDEIYVDFAIGEPLNGTNDVTISYGEYVSTGEIESYAPFVDRAERLARFYHESLGASSATEAMPLMCEWTSLATSKERDPRIVTVHLFLRM